MQNENEKHFGGEVKTEEEMSQRGKEKQRSRKIQHKCEQKAVNTNEKRTRVVHLTINMAREA